MSIDQINYYSERGHQLLYTGRSAEVPIITLENYPKWYRIHVIRSDTSVSTVPNAVVYRALDSDPLAKISGHLFHPRLLYRAAAIMNADVDDRAIEVAAGRWMIEYVDMPDFRDIIPRRPN